MVLGCNAYNSAIMPKNGLITDHNGYQSRQTEGNRNLAISDLDREQRQKLTTYTHFAVDQQKRPLHIHLKKCT